MRKTVKSGKSSKKVASTKAAKPAVKKSKASRSKVKRSPKKVSLDFGYLAKAGLIAAALIAVSAGLFLTHSATKDDSDTDLKVTQNYTANSGNGSVYIVAPETARVGEVVKAEVWTNSDELVNAAQANVAYSSNLEYVRVDDSNSAYDVDAPIMNKDNMVYLPKGTLTPLSDRQLVGVIEFKATQVGTATLSLDEETALLTHNGNNNIAQVTPSVSVNVIGE